MLTRRLAIFALVALLLPTFLVPGRIAVCMGECACAASSSDEGRAGEAAEEAEPACACCRRLSVVDTCDGDDTACGCSTIPGPRRENRPSFPNCAVFERGFGESTAPESFDWECPELVAIALRPATPVLTAALRPERIRPVQRDPRDPPPRPTLPLLI